MKFKYHYDFKSGFKMHFAGSSADWLTVPRNKQNPWQRVAQATKGILTPGNVVSVVGFLIVMYGVGLLARGEHPLSAVVWIAIGRSFDLIDGYVAHVTHTKSLVGEAVDTTLDKILLFSVLVVVIKEEYVPLWIIGILFAQAIVNVLAGVVAKLFRKVYHPSKQGKWATFASWVTLLSFSLSKLTTNVALEKILLACAYISFVFFSLYGLQASAMYVTRLLASKLRS